MTTYTKDPNATLDYSVDWNDWLNPSDNIASASWIVPSGITLVSESLTSNVATAVISGGTISEDYEVTCRVTSTSWMIDDRTFTITIKEK